MSAEPGSTADSTGRTAIESTNDSGSTGRNPRPQRSSDATRTTGGLRAWPDADSTGGRDPGGSSKAGDARSDPVDQDQSRTPDIRRRDEDRRGENRREGENESNETGGRTRYHHDGYRRGRGGHHGHNYRRHEHRRREPQVTEEDGDENDRRDAGRGETGSHSHHHEHRRREPQGTEEDGDENDRGDARRGEYGNRRFSTEYWDGKSPAQVIDGFKIGIKKRNRQIETLENEKAEQANEIEQLKAQLNLLARAQIDREKLEQLLKEWISAGFSFNSIEDPEVRKLFSDLIPGATIPHRDQLSGTILKRAVAQHEYHLQTEAKGQLATLQCDGWRDVSKKHLVAFMYTMAREVSDQPTHFW